MILIDVISVYSMSRSRKYQRWFVLTFWYETLVFFHRPLYSMKVFLMTNLTNQQLARDPTTIPQNLLSSTLIVSVLKRSSVDSSFWFHSLLFQKTCRIVYNEKHSVFDTYHTQNEQAKQLVDLPSPVVDATWETLSNLIMSCLIEF